MKGLEFSKSKSKRPLSHYNVTVSHIVPKSTFKDSNHIDTVKPGTLLGFTDSKGNIIEEHYNLKHNQQTPNQPQSEELDEELGK